MRWIALALVTGCWGGKPAPIANTAPPAPADRPLGDARVVERMPGGGVISLDGDIHMARRRAEVVMAGHCNGDYEITQELDRRIHYLCRLPSKP